MTHLDHLDFQSAHSFSRGEHKNLKFTTFSKNTCEPISIFDWEGVCISLVPFPT